MKVEPFHSVDPSLIRKVYHDNDTCSEGKKIDGRHKKPGTGGRTKCELCQKLT